DCIHCHMIPHALYDHQNQQGTFKKEALWLYPLPENVGLKLDTLEGNWVREVIAGSPADKAGLKAGDFLRQGNGVRLLTQGDFIFVLNGVGADGKLVIEAERAGKPVIASLQLTGNWRWTDISWRKSIRELPPRVGFYGGELKPQEKAGLKISEEGLA